MRIVRTVIATCMFVGLATGASLAGAGSGSGSGSAKAAGSGAAAGSGSAAKAPAMEMPKPPAELADVQKKMVGTWKCTGKAVMGPDMQMVDTAGNLQFSVDLDKWWSKASLTTAGKSPYKMESFTSYDATSKKWVEVSIDNVGGYGVMTSDGPKDKVSTWTGTSTGMGMSAQTKSVRTMVSDKDEKIEDSMSKDGKTWVPTVAVECKK